MSKPKIAVIGSGISGLSVSYFLSKKFEVHLLEKNNYLGGHTRTVNIKVKNHSFNIDTGFIVFNNRTYPDLSKFFNLLDVKVGDSNMSFSLSLGQGNFEYSGSDLNSLFAQRKNIFSLKFILLVFEIFKLYNKCNKLKINRLYENLTLEEFLNLNNYSQNLRNLHIYPIISSIWSSNKNEIKNFPLVAFINFFKNHGLFNLKNRPKWKYVINGSNNYINKILSKKNFNYTKNSFVKKITRKNDKIIININNEKNMIFDKVILATHADQALSLLEDPSSAEYNILSKFKYSKNKAFLHSDTNMMPKNKLAWSSWNFLGESESDNQFSLTYWMNNLQNISSKNNYFVSINPNTKPKNIYDSKEFEHPIFNLNTIKAQKNILSIQGYLNTYYCGSYCGYGFHEDGIQSAAFIADLLNIEIPWKRDKFFQSRLNYKK